MLVFGDKPGSVNMIVRRKCRVQTTPVSRFANTADNPSRGKNVPVSHELPGPRCPSAERLNGRHHLIDDRIRDHCQSLGVEDSVLVPPHSVRDAESTLPAPRTLIASTTGLIVDSSK